MHMVPQTDRVTVKVPRPLTNKERRKLRERAGDARPEQLQALAAKFGHHHDRGQREVSKSTNGWVSA